MAAANSIDIPNPVSEQGHSVTSEWIINGSLETQCEWVCPYDKEDIYVSVQS